MMRYRQIYILLGLTSLFPQVHAEYNGPKLISADKTWEYIEEDKRAYSDPDYPEDADWRFIYKQRYEFGKTEVINGKTYYEWILKDIESWRMTFWWVDPREIDPDIDYSTINPEDYLFNSDWIREFRELNEPIAMLREEDGIVYKLLDQDKVSLYDNSEGQWKKVNVYPGEEAILYDMNGEYQQSYTMLIEDTGLCKAYITDVSKYETAGKTLRKISFVTDYTWDRYNYPLPIERMWNDPESSSSYTSQFIEGIGLISEGTLTDIHVQDNIYPMCWVYYPKLLRVSQDNSIIYENLDAIPEIAAIKEAYKKKITSNMKLHDLMGREILNPQPGTVYIRGGKKLVAK